MAKGFVAISDGLHAWLRASARDLPLCPIPDRAGRWSVSYPTMADLPGEAGGRLGPPPPLCGRLGAGETAPPFEAARLDPRCCRDLRLRPRGRGPGLLSGEVLLYGTGTLRACNDPAAPAAPACLWREHGPLQSRHELVSARIRALRPGIPGEPGPLIKESYDSTNVLYGDAYGELEQLWERRADTVFLDEVVRLLRQLAADHEVAGMMDPPLNVPAIWRLHLKAQGLWNRPPAHARSLLRRIERILDHTLVDQAPITLLRASRQTRAADATGRDG